MLISLYILFRKLITWEQKGNFKSRVKWKTVVTTHTINRQLGLFQWNPWSSELICILFFDHFGISTCIIFDWKIWYFFTVFIFFIYQENWFVSGDGVHIWLLFIFLCHVFHIIFDLKAKIFSYTSNNGLYQVLGFTFACFWLV